MLNFVVAQNQHFLQCRRHGWHADESPDTHRHVYVGNLTASASPCIGPTTQRKLLISLGRSRRSRTDVMLILSPPEAMTGHDVMTIVYRFNGGYEIHNIFCTCFQETSTCLCPTSICPFSFYNRSGLQGILLHCIHRPQGTALRRREVISFTRSPTTSAPQNPLTGHSAEATRSRDVNTPPYHLCHAMGAPLRRWVDKQWDRPALHYRFGR